MKIKMSSLFKNVFLKYLNFLKCLCFMIHKVHKQEVWFTSKTWFTFKNWCVFFDTLCIRVWQEWITSKRPAPYKLFKQHVWHNYPLQKLVEKNDREKLMHERKLVDMQCIVGSVFSFMFWESSTKNQWRRLRREERIMKSLIIWVALCFQQ